MGRGPALHGLGSGLEDIQQAVDPVLGPFDVHGLPIVLFDRERVACERFGLGVREGIAPAILGGHCDDPRRRVARLAQDHLFRLVAEVAPDHGRPAGPQVGFIDTELVGVDLPLDHQLPEPVGRGDEDHLRKPRFRVEREQDAARAHVAPHHALDPGRQRHGLMREAVVGPIGDGPVVIKRSEDPSDGLEHRLDPADVQEGLLLAREGRLGQVLCRRRGAHRDGQCAPHPIEPPIGRRDRLGEARRERGTEEPSADLGAGRGQRPHILHIEPDEPLADAPFQVLLAEKVAIGLGGGRESAGYSNTGLGEMGDHLAERGVLAADPVDIPHPDRLEIEDIGWCHRPLPASLRRSCAFRLRPGAQAFRRPRPPALKRSHASGGRHRAAILRHGARAVFETVRLDPAAYSTPILRAVSSPRARRDPDTRSGWRYPD